MSAISRFCRKVLSLFGGPADDQVTEDLKKETPGALVNTSPVQTFPTDGSYNLPDNLVMTKKNAVPILQVSLDEHLTRQDQARKQAPHVSPVAQSTSLSQSQQERNKKTAVEQVARDQARRRRAAEDEENRRTNSDSGMFVNSPYNNYTSAPYNTVSNHSSGSVNHGCSAPSYSNHSNHDSGHSHSHSSSDSGSSDSGSCGGGGD